MNTLFELGEQVRNRYTVREIHWQRVYFTRTHVTLLFHNFTFIIYKYGRSVTSGVAKIFLLHG